MKRILAFLLLLSNLPSAHAGEWEFGGYLAQYQFNRQKAVQEGVDDTALGLGFIADYWSESLTMLSLGLDFISYDDNRSFSQTVEVDGGFDDGEIRNESSDATAMTFFAEAGPRWAFGYNERNYASLKLGFNAVIASDRSISYCSDCYDEDIDIDGGAYVAGAISHSFSAVSLGLHYQQFLDDEEGFDSGVRLVISTGF